MRRPLAPAPHTRASDTLVTFSAPRSAAASASLIAPSNSHRAPCRRSAVSACGRSLGSSISALRHATESAYVHSMERKVKLWRRRWSAARRVLWHMHWAEHHATSRPGLGGRLVPQGFWRQAPERMRTPVASRRWRMRRGSVSTEGATASSPTTTDVATATATATAGFWTRAGRRVLGHGVGFGYKLWRPVVLAALLWVIGLAVFTTAASRDGLIPTEPDAWAQAGAVTAALFLQRFAPEGPWVHLDIFAWNPRGKPGVPAGGEVMAIRGLFRMLQDRFA